MSAGNIQIFSPFGYSASSETSPSDSFSLPPVEYCRGTIPTQAPKSRPRRNAAPLPMAATVAVETNRPKPGIWRSCRQRASSLLMRSISPVIASMSVSSCFHSCHSRSSSPRRRPLRLSSIFHDCGEIFAQVNRLRRKGDATLQQKATDLVEQCGAALHESIPHPVHGLPVELLLGLDLHKAHVLLRHGFGDRLRIDEII